MQLNRTQTYLDLIIHTMEASIVPNLTSASARAAADIVVRCTRELLRREQMGIDQLTADNAAGRALAQQLRSLLEDAGVKLDHSVRPAPPSNNCFSDLAEEFAAISSELYQLLAAAGSRQGSIIQQDPAYQKLARAAAEWECGAHTSVVRATKEPADAAQELPEALSSAGLRAFIASVHPDGDQIEVFDLERVSGGFAKQTYFFTLQAAHGAREDLVIRKMDVSPMLRLKAFRIENEFELLRALSDSGLPAPQPRWLAVEPVGADASFCVVNKLPGRVVGSFLDRNIEITETLVISLAETLAALHSIPLERLTGFARRVDDEEVLNESLEECYRRQVGQWRDYVRDQEHLPSPTVVYVVQWLLRNIPKLNGRPVLVHGDFGPHNIMSDGHVVTGLLDWECAMFGAPEQDIAYLQPHIPRKEHWDLFIDRYTARTQRKLDFDSFRFYHAFSMLRIMLGSNRGTLDLQTGRSRDIRLAMLELGLYPDFIRSALASTSDNV